MHAVKRGGVWERVGGRARGDRPRFRGRSYIIGGSSGGRSGWTDFSAAEVPVGPLLGGTNFSVTRLGGLVYFVT